MFLTTARLTLRPQEQADAPALFAILNDAQAMRFWHRPAIARPAVAEELVREQQAAMAEGLCRYWTVLEGGDAIGSVDLSLIEGGSAELGFLLRRDRWGLGLASEAAGAAIAHGFGPLRLDGLAAATQAGNEAAARVLEKNGFALRDRRLVFLAGGALVDCAFYLLRRKEHRPEPERP
ncbi:MAG TPA: GNAT family N-acetyltransferase [Rhizomicrobium sp.]